MYISYVHDRVLHFSAFIIVVSEECVEFAAHPVRLFPSFACIHQLAFNSLAGVVNTVLFQLPGPYAENHGAETAPLWVPFCKDVITVFGELYNTVHIERPGVNTKHAAIATLESSNAFNYFQSGHVRDIIKICLLPRTVAL